MDMCQDNPKNQPCLFTPEAYGYTFPLNFGLIPSAANNQSIEDGAFFFCFSDYVSTNPGFTCHSFSPYFKLSQPVTAPATSVKLKRDDPGNSIDSLFSILPSHTALISVTRTRTDFLTVSGQQTTIFGTLVPTPTGTVFGATVTTTPTSPPTGTGVDSASSTSTSDTSSPTSSKSSGLPLGAKIGIALGAIIFAFLILLAILLLLRRRRKKTPPNRTPENLLLSSSLKNNDSSDLFAAEKLGLNDRTDTNTPLTSRGAGMGTNGTYDLEDDLPAPGTAFTANTPVPISPRRSQAANTLRDEGLGSRAISIASEVSRPVSPLNANPVGSNSGGLSRETSREQMRERGIFDEELYADNIDGLGVGLGAVNGGRNGSRTNLEVPQVYKGTLQAPFLSEPGMSPEEVARLEEEERRIDEAIAEAEEERRRAREGRGR
ncbi:hypothetical protein NHQ30_010543 [Ciborinia camelliae]|nr:hypothetical protein NHQ30_010543 [Ciborinia camelliae]